MLKLKTTLLFFGLLLCCNKTEAHKFEWAGQLKNGNYSEAMGIASDSKGNVYAVGIFDSRMDLDPGPGAGDTLFVTPVMGSDIYIVKLDPAGKLIWGKAVGGDGSVDQGYGVALDEAGNVYVTGNFSGKADFNPGTRPEDTFFLKTPTTISTDIFVLKLDPAGNFVWARQFASTGGGDAGRAITSKAGFVYTTGYFQGKADFNPGTNPADTFYLSATGGTTGSIDIFISKLDTAGNFVWAGAVGGATNSTFNELGTGITVDESGNIYCAGNFTNNADFDPGPGVQPLTSATTTKPDAFILKLDSAGNYIWARRAGGTQSDKAYRIAYDGGDGLYISGSFEATADLDPDPVNTAILTSAGLSDAYLLKLDTAGIFQWVRQVAGALTDAGGGVSTDAAGNVYSTGAFVDSAVVDTSGVYVKQTDPDYEDTYILKHDRNGKLIWAKSFGGAGGWVYPSDLSVNRSGHVYTTGIFEVPANFDTENGNFTLTPGGGFDPFIHKLHCSDTNSSQLNVSLCNQPSYVIHGDTLTASGVYTWIFPNVTGCDSTVTLDLILNTIPVPQINVNDKELSVTGPYTGYQWIRNDTAIQGATASTYIVTANADYRVAVTGANGCHDTSGVYQVSNIGIPGAEGIAGLITVYPNPAGSMVYIGSPVPVRLALTSLEGRVLRMEQNTNSISVAGLAAGTYMIRISDTEGVQIKTVKFTKIP